MPILSSAFQIQISQPFRNFDFSNLADVTSRRDSLADDEREGRPSFRESDAVKNEVRDVINGDRRLTVREVADKCGISKTTVQ
jgi:hypothetical protein